MNIRPSCSSDPALRRLLEAQDAEYAEMYPPEINFTIPIEALRGPNLGVYVVEDQAQSIGCGAILSMEGFAEVKRLYIVPERRGRGFARRLMHHLEDAARAYGHTMVRLETGKQAPDAIQLYERLGYVRIGAFPPYVENDSSIFMEKAL